MQYYSPRGFNLIPPVIKNLLIINVLVFLFLFVGGPISQWMQTYLSLRFPLSNYFNPSQLVTYMFMHSASSPFHLIFNMFGLWMFGTYVENIWGAKRFLIYYMVCGIGSAMFQLGINFIDYFNVTKLLDEAQISEVANNGWELLQSGKTYGDPLMARLNRIVNIPMVGASGAIYGILVAFGMLFPNAYVNIYFFIPVKAKYFVMILMGISLISGLMNNPNDNVAHFAHLGGGLVGFLWLNIGKLFKRPRY